MKTTDKGYMALLNATDMKGLQEKVNATMNDVLHRKLDSMVTIQKQLLGASLASNMYSGGN